MTHVRHANEHANTTRRCGKAGLRRKEKEEQTGVRGRSHHRAPISNGLCSRNCAQLVHFHSRFENVFGRQRWHRWRHRQPITVVVVRDPSRFVSSGHFRIHFRTILIRTAASVSVSEIARFAATWWRCARFLLPLPGYTSGYTSRHVLAH